MLSLRDFPEVEVGAIMAMGDPESPPPLPPPPPPQNPGPLGRPIAPDKPKKKG